MLDGALALDVHKEYSGMIEEEVIVQGGNVQAAFQSYEHSQINFVFEENSIAHDHCFTVRGFSKASPRGQSHERRHFPAIDGNRDVVAWKADFVSTFLVVKGSF